MNFFCPLCNSFLKLNSINEIFECTTCSYQDSIKDKVLYRIYANTDNISNIKYNDPSDKNYFISIEPYRRIHIECNQCKYDIGILKTNNEMKSSIYCEKCNFLLPN